MGNRCFWCKVALAALGAILVGLAAWYGGAFTAWAGTMTWLAGKIGAALGLAAAAKASLARALGHILFAFLGYLTYRFVEYVLCQICKFLGFCEECQDPMS